MTTGKTILLVEDNADARLVLTAIIDHGGYRVVEAGTGAEGLEAALRDHPDLIIMDVHMPGMCGFQTSQALRDDDRTKAIPILAVTADRFDHERGEGVFDSCIWKPIQPLQLMGHIREMIGAP